MFESAKHAPFSRPTTLHLAGYSSFSHYIFLPKKSSSKMSQPMQYSCSTPADMCKGKTKLKVQYIGQVAEAFQMQAVGPQLVITLA
jgi:hypothetical protein